VAACENNACVIRNKPDDTACDDGLFCTVNDVCTGGVCGGRPRDCGDGITCTVDRCDEDANACINRPDDGACDDGVECTVDRCDPVAGCINRPDDGACDDNNVCTRDFCDPVLGCQHEEIPCPPRPGCVVDRCDPVDGCIYICAICHHSLPEETQGCMGACQRSGVKGCGSACNRQCNVLCPNDPQSNDRECDDPRACLDSSWINCDYQFD
jgi:hypothetical protein